MKMMGRINRSALVAAVFAGVFAARSDAGVLETLPSNVTAFVYVKDVAEVNSHAAALATAANLTDFAKDFADPLAFVKSNLAKNGAGINDSGDFAIAFVDSAEPNPEDSVALVSISNFDEFVSNFAAKDGTAPVKGENGIVTAQDGGKKMYIAHWGDYAAVGGTEKAVTKPAQSGVTLNDWTKKQLESNDVSAVMLTAEMNRIDPKRAEKVVAHLTKLSDMAGQMSGGMMPANEQLTQKPMKLVIEKFMTESEVGVMGLSFSEKGIRFNARAQFKEGSYLANMVSKTKAPAQPLLSTLPDDTYMMYGAMSYDSELATQVMDDFLKAVGTDLNTTGDPMKGPNAEQMQQMRTLVASSKGMLFAGNPWVVDADKKLKTPGYLFVEGDGAKIKTTMAEMSKSAATKTPEPVAGEEEKPQRRRGMEPKVDVKVTENARTVGTTSFDQIDVTMTGIPMAGFGNSTTFYGATNNGLLAFRDMSDESVMNVLAFKNADSITQSANHQMVAADLPANRFAEFYLQPEQMVAGFGTAAAQMFGMDMKLTAPAGLPPIGMAFAADGNVLSAEVVVPAKSIDGTAKFVRDTINKAFGGGGGGDDEGGKADEDL